MFGVHLTVALAVNVLRVVAAIFAFSLLDFRRRFGRADGCDVRAVGGIHRRVLIAVKHNRWRCLARRIIGGDAARTARTHAAVHHGKRGLHVLGRARRQARMHAHSSEQIGIRVAQNRRHRAACGQACNVDALRVDVVRRDDFARHVGQNRGLAQIALLMAAHEPVPAT